MENKAPEKAEEFLNTKATDIPNIAFNPYEWQAICLWMQEYSNYRLNEIRDKVEKGKIFGLHADFYNEGIDMALDILDSYINEK